MRNFFYFCLLALGCGGLALIGDALIGQETKEDKPVSDSEYSDIYNSLSLYRLDILPVVDAALVDEKITVKEKQAIDARYEVLRNQKYKQKLKELVQELHQEQIR